MKKSTEELQAEADECARKYAAHNPSNSFAYARAYASIIHGWMSIEDFRGLNFNPHI